MPHGANDVVRLNEQAWTPPPAEVARPSRAGAGGGGGADTFESFIPFPEQERRKKLGLKQLEKPPGLKAWEARVQGESHFMNRQEKMKKEYGEERTTGFVDIDTFNALPEEDKMRIRDHSVKLFKTFKPTKYFLHGLGLFPFMAKLLDDGSYSFRLNRCSLFYILYLMSTVILTILFILFTFGLLFMFSDAIPHWQVHDRCGNTWGGTVISRNFPAVIFVWCNLMVAAVGCIQMITHSRKFLEFYNVVNEAVMQMDADATPGLHKANFKSSFSFFAILLMICLTFCFVNQKALEETMGFVAQAVLYIYNHDMFYVGVKHRERFTAKDFDELLEKCSTVCKGCYGPRKADHKATCYQNNCYNHINTPTPQFTACKWLGFIITFFALLAARAIIRQFEFFCQILVNLASIWNKRFVNYASKDNSSKIDDPYRRRLEDENMLKDHYQIIKLYEVAEENFSRILFLYYSSVFFSLICQMYYAALLSSQVTCALGVQRERAAAKANKCYVNQTENIDVVKDVLEHGHRPGDHEIVSFEDACSVVQTDIISSAAFANLILIVLTLSSFILTTLQADKASHQADVGFYHVRRKGYLSCRTKEERVTMHALVFSFTGPKPFAITAAGFFPVRKKTIIVLTSVAFIYFLIILSFKPGMNFSHNRCYTINPNARDSHEEQVFIVKYPKVI